eukprot:1392396-Rhodomonas_salina.5
MGYGGTRASTTRLFSLFVVLILVIGCVALLAVALDFVPILLDLNHELYQESLNVLVKVKPTKRSAVLTQRMCDGMCSTDAATDTAYVLWDVQY